MSRRNFIRLSVLGAAGFASYLYYQESAVAISNYTIFIDHLPSSFEGFTILHISDLHNKTYGKDQQALIELIDRQKFDLVAITGDLVSKISRLANADDSESTQAVTELILGLKDKPTYFVSGNHEWWTGYKIKSSLISAGVKILGNTAARFVRDDSHIWLVGVDDPFTGRDRLDLAVNAVDDGAPRILLAHAPNIYQSAVASGIDLVLVGHTHGGQVRLPFAGAIIVPGQGVFPKYDYGLFKSGKTKMVISSGLGETVLPLRINCRPEIGLIKFIRS